MPDLAISGYGGVQLLHNMGDGTFIELAPLVSHTVGRLEFQPGLG